MATLEQARFWLARKRPYLSSLLFALPVVFTRHEDMLTMSVDLKGRLYINPDFLASLSPAEAGTVLYHEVLHVLREHVKRGLDLGVNSLNWRAWNAAIDAEINDDIRQEDFPLPGKPILPESLNQPEGKLAEEYYRNLPQIDLEELLRLAGVGNEGEGSGITGIKGSWELEGDQGSGLSPEELEVLKQAVAQAIAEQASRQPGSVPGHLERWAQERLSPKVDWRKALRTLVRQHLGASQGRTDYRYDRPNRRQSITPFVLPRLRAPQPRLALVVDTSGSMGDRELAQALAEIQGVIQAAGAPVDVASGDVGIQSFQRGVFQASRVQLKGGGGTDMGLALEQLKETRNRYDLVVVLTDGWSPWPERNPLDCPVLVVSTDKQGPDWAETILIREERR